MLTDIISEWTKGPKHRACTVLVPSSGKVGDLRLGTSSSLSRYAFLFSFFCFVLFPVLLPSCFSVPVLILILTLT